MTNINLSQKTYTDYVASLYFKACGCTDIKFTPKVVKVNDKDVILIHVSGVQMNTGIVVNVDLWPRDNATEADIKALPKSVDDIQFRIGFWPEFNEDGSQVLRAGAPKWTAYSYGSDSRTLSGDKREYEG